MEPAKNAGKMVSRFSHHGFVKSDLSWGGAAPRSQARNPPRDIRAEFFVLTPKAPTQCRLLVDDNKEKESHPNYNAVFKNLHTAEQQTLTENQHHDRNIHGISHVSKQPANYQMLRWEDWCGRTETLERETGEGVQKHWKTCCNQQHSQDPKGGSPQQRCSNVPSANPPRQVTCDDPGATTRNIAEPRMASVRLIAFEVVITHPDSCVASRCASARPSWAPRRVS